MDIPGPFFLEKNLPLFPPRDVLYLWRRRWSCVPPQLPQLSFSLSLFIRECPAEHVAGEAANGHTCRSRVARRTSGPGSKLLLYAFGCSAAVNVIKRDRDHGNQYFHRTVRGLGGEDGVTESYQGVLAYESMVVPWQ
jgi:hypothetical protein